MQTRKLILQGPKIVRPRIFNDVRGFFLEAYQEKRYKELELPDFVQDNHSFSKHGVIRGMHFQSDPPQAKLIYVIFGKIFDVIVDIREGSSSFGKWEGVILDDEFHEQLFVPAGFAHGFCVISDQAHVIYKVSAPYSPQAEQTFRFDDPNIGIRWPVNRPIVSERDQKAPLLQDLNIRSGL